jgi:hypothetical protein
VSTYLSANAARLTDIQVESATPTFTVVMVKNSGAYQSAWWWFYGLTEADVNTQLANHAARPISISAYATSSGVRYAVVMVQNAGANLRASWWYHGTASFIATQLTTNHARLINVSPYPGGGYVGIMVDNAASPLSWWWYVGKSTTAINTYLAANHARLIDLSRNDNGTYNAVMYANTSTRWFWFYGVSPTSALNKANQRGARILDATSWLVNGVKHQAVIMVDDLNALAEQLWNVIGPKVDSGSYGFYLKQVGVSGNLAALEATKQYEPASALKVLYHAKSIHAESLGESTDAQLITYHYHNLADPKDGDICPDDYATTTTTNLKNADILMMQNSDNRMTRGILEKYGKTAMLNYASSLGLTSTQINHNIGCGTPHNKTTLVDLGKVYEQFQNGTVTSNPTWQANFRVRMLTESNYSPFRASICPVVDQEATSLGLSASTATSFCDAITWVSKGGSYQYGTTFPYGVSWGSVSLTGLPFNASGSAAPRYYVFGEFVDGTTIDTQAEADSINGARATLYLEAMRPYIRSALKTWP